MSDNESIIWGLIRSHQDKKARKRMMENIAIENENNKGVTRYQPSQIEAFFSTSDPLGNIVISGGTQALRNRAIIGSMYSAANSNVPIIVLHAGNQALETMLQQQIRSLVVFNRRTSIYEPFLGLSTLEISRTIQSSATKMCEIRSGGQYYIEGITEFIRTKNIPPYCEMYISCPHLELFDKVDEAESKGYISSAVCQRIKTTLVQGQAQRSDVENYFNVLRHQTQGLLASKANLSRATNLRSVINQNGIAIFDVGSNINDLLMNLVMEDIVSTLNSGKKVLIIIDGIKASISEKLERFIQTSGTSTNVVISSEDIYSALNADDNLFASTMGKSIKTVIYQHVSGLSCTKLAEFIGYYEKLEINRQYSHGVNRQNMFTVLPSEMDNEMIGVTPKREYKVRPEEISQMNKDEVYVLNSVDNELAFTQVV